MPSKYIKKTVSVASGGICEMRRGKVDIYHIATHTVVNN